MTLKEVIKRIEGVASSQPTVNMIVRNDVFRLNGCHDAKYGAFAWLQQPHSETLDDDQIGYAFTLFYVDRLNEDKSNEIDVESVAVSTLGNIIRSLADYGIYAESWAYTTFNQRFHDECAGAFCNVTFYVNNSSVCDEDFSVRTIKII